MTYDWNSTKPPHYTPSAGSSNCTPSTDPCSLATTCQFHSMEYCSSGEALSRLLQFLLVVCVLFLISSPLPCIFLQQTRDGCNCVHFLFSLLLNFSRHLHLLLTLLLLSLAHIEPLAQYRHFPPSLNHPPHLHVLFFQLLFQHFIAVLHCDHILHQTLLVCLHSFHLHLCLKSGRGRYFTGFVT